MGGISKRCRSGGKIPRGTHDVLEDTCLPTGFGGKEKHEVTPEREMKNGMDGVLNQMDKSQRALAGRRSRA